MSSKYYVFGIAENWLGPDSIQVPFWQMGSHQDIVRNFNSRVQIMLFDWPASYCSPEHISRPSHTARLLYGATLDATAEKY